MVVLVYLTQHLLTAIGIDRFHRHDSATHMHMGSIAVDDSWGVKHVSALQNLIPVRWNDNVLTSGHAVETIDTKHRLTRCF